MFGDGAQTLKKKMFDLNIKNFFKCLVDRVSNLKNFFNCLAGPSSAARPAAGARAQDAIS